MATDNRTGAGMMKRGLVALMSVAVLMVSACSGGGDPSDSVAMPASSKALEGQNVDDVALELREAGFTNVETVALGDLITGWLNGEGEVEEVSVDGESSFDEDDTFDPNAAIVVSYHSFPVEDEPTEVEPTDDGSTEASPSSDPATASPTTAAAEVLTVDTNADLAALLALTDYCSDDVAAFAATYAGATIAFDGNIGAMANHGDYDTRYDILVGGGDFSETSQPGPSFQFRDVNVTNDLKLVGSDVPDTIGVGDNFRFTAEVVEYESASCLFLLDPISTEFRQVG